MNKKRMRRLLAATALTVGGLLVAISPAGASTVSSFTQAELEADGYKCKRIFSHVTECEKNGRKYWCSPFQTECVYKSGISADVGVVGLDPIGEEPPGRGF